MPKNTALIAAIVIILIVGGWFLIRPKQQPQSIPSSVSTPPSTESTTPATDGASVATGENMVNIATNGFSPDIITIKAGDSVTWTNSDSAVHTVNSAIHPTHQAYPPLNLGNIQAGDKKSLVFPTAGVYKYHDHLNPSLTGQVTVE